jgi:hypothetical protein
MNSYYRLLGCHTVSFGSGLLMFPRNVFSFVSVSVRPRTLTTDASASTETSVTCHQTAWRHIQGAIYIHSHQHRNRNFYKHRIVVTSKAEKKKKKKNIVLYHKLIAERDRNISKTVWNASNVWRQITLIVCVHIMSYIYFLKFHS